MVRSVTRRQFIAIPLAGSIGAIAGVQSGNEKTVTRPRQKRMKIGYHFWNCSRQWDTDLDRCLRLAKKAGYQGFEALLEKVRVTPAQFKAKCQQTGLNCAAISGKLKEAIDFAYEAGIPSVRCHVPKEETNI